MNSTGVRKRRTDATVAATSEKKSETQNGTDFEVQLPGFLSKLFSESGWKRRKARDWAAVLLAPRNVVTLVYALSYTTTSAVLPFLARRHLTGTQIELTASDGSTVIEQKGGVPEAYRGLYYGAVMSGYYATKMIAAPLIGFLSDKVGRRRMVMVTFFGSSATFVATTFVGQHSIQALLVCRLLMGCFAGNGALMMAYIKDSVPKEDQSSAFAQHSAAWGLAYVLAAPLLAVLREDTTRCLAFAAACMATAGLLAATFFDEMPAEQRLRSRTLSDSGGPGRDRLSSTSIHGATSSAAAANSSRGRSASTSGKIDSSTGTCSNRSNSGGGSSSSSRKPKGQRRKRRQLKALLNVFRTMLQERLVLGIFLLQVIRPAQDLVPLVDSKFGAGAAFVAVISSIRATFRVLLPLTPLIPMLNSAVRRKGGQGQGTAASDGGDREVAAVMCVLMAGIVAIIPFCPNKYAMYVLMVIKGMCYVIKESTVSAVMSGLASSGSIGAFFGWQHFMKGLAGVSSHMVTGVLSSRSMAMPYFATAICDLLYAAAYMFA